MENRNYIIDRLKSKTMSIDEFNYDRLSAPPISAMFTPQDIAQLNYIAKSLKYSAKPHIKYQEIDKIMRRRGFEKFIAGTNRVVYRALEDNSFVVKVAADAVGLGDNPREYQNQFIFKPFVTKVFEVTPCGTLGVFERVNPITSREEFLSVAEDIFSVINDWFIGEYVLEDIGTKFFMNWSVRKGFGPVLLDFPYVYKLDGDKLFCNAPSINNPSGCCEGVIDYDAGYNFLYCTKCGVKYKAKELAQAIENNNVIVKSEGEFKMKVELSGGTKNINKDVVLDKKCTHTPSKPIKNKEEKKEVICPVEFDESLIKKTSDDNKTLVNKYIDSIKKIIESTEDDNEKKELENLVTKGFETQIDKLVKPIKDELNDTIKKLEEITDDTDREVEHTVETCLNMASELYMYKEDDSIYLDNIHDDFINMLLPKLIEEAFRNNENYIISNICDIIDWDEDGYCLVFKVTNNFGINKLCNSSFKVNIETLSDLLEKQSSLTIVEKDDWEKFCNNDKKKESDEVRYEDFRFFTSKIVNTKDILPNQDSCKVIVLVDHNDNYLTCENSNDIIAIDEIDDRSLEGLSIVSKEWLEGKLSELENTTQQLPTGMVPPEEISVNGVPTSDEE